MNGRNLQAFLIGLEGHARSSEWTEDARGCISAIRERLAALEKVAEDARNMVEGVDPESWAQDVRDALKELEELDR